MFKKIVILTGAGISAESGIPVFRSETGLWEQERVEDVATYEGFARNARKVHDFYNKMRKSIRTKEPNPAHLALTRLQSEYAQKFAADVTIVTQNIDDLHEKAGSKDVIHMHGELNSILCEHCLGRYEYHDDSSSALAVYPAAGFCSVAKSTGAYCVEFNLEKSAVASNFTRGIYGKASVTVPAFVDELIKTGTFSEE